MQFYEPLSSLGNWYINFYCLKALRWLWSETSVDKTRISAVEIKWYCFQTREKEMWEKEEGKEGCRKGRMKRREDENSSVPLWFCKARSIVCCQAWLLCSRHLFRRNPRETNTLSHSPIAISSILILVYYFPSPLSSCLSNIFPNL